YSVLHRSTMSFTAASYCRHLSRLRQSSLVILKFLYDVVSRKKGNSSRKKGDRHLFSLAVGNRRHCTIRKRGACPLFSKWTCWHRCFVSNSWKQGISLGSWVGEREFGQSR